MGTLYYGDNLDILKRYIKDESVDLVYLDPPFNSAQNYNAFFQEKDGTAAASQIRAFEDTWTWNQESQRVYEELIFQPGKVSEVMQAFRTFLGTNDMMAYLAMIERPTSAASFDVTFKKAPSSSRKSAEEQALPGI
jgi:adenine specific DNA methylase Mod